MFHGNWTEATCNRLYLVMPILTTMGLACSETICAMRVYAILRRDRLLFIVLVSMLTAMVGIQSYAISDYTAFQDDRGSCIAAGQGVWLAAYWLAPAILDVSEHVQALVAP